MHARQWPLLVDTSCLLAPLRLGLKHSDAGAAGVEADAVPGRGGHDDKAEE